VAGGACCAQAVVLVGGEGTRLRPITSRVPKPVVPLVGRPFVGYILENLARHGVERVVFSAGYLAHALEDAIGDGSRYGLDVRYVVEDRPLGTAGAIRNVQAELDDGCLLAFNGDVLTDVDLTAMSAFHRERGGLATILLTRVDDPRRYGLVEIADDGRVAEFIEKPGAEYAVPTRGALINAGVYLLEPEVLAMIPAGRQLSIERGVFPELAAAGRLYAFVSNAYWRDIGTPESYLQAHFDLLRSAIATSVSRDVGPSYLYVAPDALVAPGGRAAGAHRRRHDSGPRQPRRAARRDRLRLHRRGRRRDRRVGRAGRGDGRPRGHDRAQRRGQRRLCWREQLPCQRRGRPRLPDRRRQRDR